MLALQYRKSVPRYLWVRLLGRRFPSVATAPGGMLRPAEVPAPGLPTDRWARVRPILSGICGSDLATVAGKSSIYLSAFTSFPFVPGHEVVGQVVETGPRVSRVAAGDRVVLEPALGCDVRGIQVRCGPCRDGHYANCEMVMQGDVSPGVQTGYCRDTGGGWSSAFVAHESQLHRVPDAVPDEAAVLVEPLSCAIHAVLEALPEEGSSALVVGCGAIGLLTIAALRAFAPSAAITAVAKYPHQRELALALGAEHVATPGERGYRQLGQLSGGSSHPLPLGRPAVLGGFDVAFECTGSPGGLEDAIRWTRSQGRLVLAGMPSEGRFDLAPLWYQELRVSGAYGYSLERNGGSRVKTFDMALRMLSEDGWADRLAPMLTHRFPLAQYKRAVAAAMRSGRSGAVKVAFDPAA